VTKDRGIYILTIYDCIQRIQSYTRDTSLESFLNDPKTQDAVIRNLEVLGQATKDFGIEDLVQSYPDTPWAQIAGMRNIIAHEYLGLDLTMVWEVIEKHIQPLKEATEHVAASQSITLQE
jgi:uncharacterized protein with HEPN domain